MTSKATSKLLDTFTLMRPSVQPDVSVIIPTYNRLWALPTAVESCRNSACRTEIIVVDDGSTDETWSWLQTQKDVVSIKTDNWGQCWAQNVGFAASNGEFIRFLDSDDWLLCGANDRQLEIARATQADVVVAGYEQHDQVRGCTIDKPWVGHHDFLASQIHTDCCYSAYLMRRSIVARIPQREEFSHHDSMFLMELALAKPAVAIGHFSSMACRNHAFGHLSARRGLEAGVAAWRSIVMYRKILTLLEKRGECSELRKDALLRALWHEARNFAEWNMRQASETVSWIKSQDGAFTPPVSDFVNLLYRTIGFGVTERIVLQSRTVRRFVGSLIRSF